MAGCFDKAKQKSGGGIIREIGVLSGEGGRAVIDLAFFGGTRAGAEVTSGVACVGGLTARASNLYQWCE